MFTDIKHILPTIPTQLVDLVPAALKYSYTPLFYNT